METLPKSSVNILCTNVRGLGQFRKNRYRLNGVPYKIKEMVSSCRHIPTIYFCLETKLKSFHRRIRLPRGMRYIGETSCDSGQGGIFGFMDTCFSIEDRNRDVKVIVSKHAMFVRVKIGNEYLNLIPVYLPSNRTKLILSCKDLVTSPDFRERKREGGKKISSKEMGEMGFFHYNRLS